MTNARRSREKHRQEREAMEFEQFEQERIEAMAARNEVYLCSGTQVHNDACEGDCGFRVLDDIEIEINNEHMRWQGLSMVPLGSLPQLPQIPGVPVNLLKLEVAVAALSEMVYEKTDISREELNKKFQEMYLNRITTIREMNEEGMIEARRMKSIGVQAQEKQLVVPDYIMRREERKH